LIKLNLTETSLRFQFSLTTILSVITALCVLLALLAFAIQSHVPWMAVLVGIYLITPLCAFYIPTKHRLLITAATMGMLLIGCFFVYLYFYRQMQGTGLRVVEFPPFVMFSLMAWSLEIGGWYVIRQLTGGDEPTEFTEIPPISDRDN
jgi:hypothetical protein